MILDTADRAAGLIGKLLTFSRSTPQASSLVDVHRIIKEALVLLENTIDRRIILEINLAAEQTAVVGDLPQLHSAFLNLGINGSHAMPNGGTLSMISRNLELDASYCEYSIFDLNPGKYLEIEVQDTGSGISPEHLNKIFDPFFTTKAHLGTGLGLATVYGTVQQHHGAIHVVSELGAGTTFQILLPLATDEQFMSKTLPTIQEGRGRVAGRGR
jgi:signal transduction histidine kinase